MKLSKSLLKTFRCAYLYGNGKLVVWHEQSHKKAGVVEWATIHNTGVKCGFDGRIIVSTTGALFVCMQAKRIDAQAADIKHGSENSRRLGIAIGYIKFNFGLTGGYAYRSDFYVYTMDGVMSTDFQYQPEVVWQQPKHDRFGDLRIASQPIESEAMETAPEVAQ